ncbi:MAG: TIGR04086 family membrane protein [Acutalibacteraceae bacterium]|nr:TIGR04086 family membrane protein [Acutalibacteraceae bacterium]
MSKIFDSEYIKSLLLSILIGATSMVAALFIFAVLFTYLDLKMYYNSIFAILALILGTFVGSSIFVSKIKTKGFLNGVLVAVIIYAIIFLVSAFVSKNSISLTTLFHIISAVLSGGIGGIIQVNKKSKYDI